MKPFVMRSTGCFSALLFLLPALVYCSSEEDGAPAGGASGAAGEAGEAGAAGSSGGASGAGAAGRAGAPPQAGEGGGAGAGQGGAGRAPLVPPIPTPGAIGDVPASEVMTSIQRWSTFQPPLDRARCDWSVSTQRCYDFAGGSDDDSCTDFTPAPESSGEYFSDEIPDDELDAPLALPHPWGYRLLLVEDGESVAPEGSLRIDNAFTSEAPGVVLSLNAIYDYECPALAGTAYMRWDRFWRLVELDSDGPFLLLDGEVEATMTATYTTGVSLSETTTFVHSTTTSVGAEFEGLSAELAETLSEAYSSTITLYEEESHEFSQTVRGVADATRQFMVWQLVDRLSVTDSEGEPLTDPNYEFPGVLLEIPSGKALKVTDFEH